MSQTSAKSSFSPLDLLEILGAKRMAEASISLISPSSSPRNAGADNPSRHFYVALLQQNLVSAIIYFYPADPSD